MNDCPSSSGSIYRTNSCQHDERRGSNITDLCRFIDLPEDDTLVVDDVTFDPPYMSFDDAFEGKKYVKKLTLRNNGRNAAFIRILPPSSRAFELATLVRGMRLCPGLSIRRTIKYTHSVGNAALANLPFVVNGAVIDYTLKVKLSTPVIKVEPDFVDFGEFATWQSPEVRTVSLKNTGARSALFAIDLGNNELELLVEPGKGEVPAGSEVILNIEMMGTKRGTFHQEFWVKCVTPIRVQVAVNFVEPTLLSYHPNVMTDFAMVDFPRTYFGTKIMKTMVLMNKSPVGVMYCSKVVIKNDLLEIKQAEERGDDMCSFEMWPPQGRIAPNESKICEIVYTPIKNKRTRKKEKFDNYALTFLQVIRVNWKDMFNVVFQDSFAISEKRARSLDLDKTESIAASIEEITEHNRNLSSSSDDFSLPTLNYMKSVTRIESANIQGSVRVCLYGEGETADVTLRPDAFHLGSLEMNQPTERELLIFNTSEVLPIIYRYKKVAFVEVIPKQGTVPPEEGKEVLVRVTPGRSGTIKTKIAFDLLYYNFPRKEGEYVVVGEESAVLHFEVPFAKQVVKAKIRKGPCGKRNLLTEELRFSTKVDIPKTIMPFGARGKYPNEHAFIAFPDDRPAVLRPWRLTEEIKTMFARIPRTHSFRDQYTLTPSEEELRRRNRAYYEHYTREEAEKLKKLYIKACREESDYDISNPKKILWEGFRPHGYQAKKEAPLQKLPSFIPLLPRELKNITVTPFMIQLEGIVPDSLANAAITIRNNNEFSIRVYVAPRKQGVMDFPKGNRKVVKGNTETEIPIRYRAENVGKHYVVIDIIINECHGCECILQARVIPGFVTTDVNHIEFLSNGPPRFYLKLTNPCNARAGFAWENTTKSLTILPARGIIPPKCYMYCKINYIPVVEEKLAAEITLISERAKLLIDVFTTFVKAKVGLSTDHLEVPAIPLNIPIRRKVVLRNFKDEIVLFRVINPKPIYGVTITPTEGLLKSFGDQIFYVNIRIPTCMQFTCSVVLEIQKIEEIKFKISGHVEYPMVSVKPNAFHLRKIFLGGFDRFKFQIENVGKCVASVKFNFEYYPEFYVSKNPEKGALALTSAGFMLEPQEQKVLYLHFHPIDVAPNCFFLPIVINDVLGPPSKIRPDTTIVSTYLSPGMNNYKPENAIETTHPTKLSCIEITNTVAWTILEFSHLDLDFFSYTHIASQSVTSLNFFASNESQEEITFTIRTKDLNGPFYLTNLEGGSVQHESDCMIITLEEGDEIILNAQFVAIAPGAYTVYAPVYLEGAEDEPHNYITLRGNHFSPTIEIPSPIVYMMPVPLGVQCESHFTAKLRYHSSKCFFSTKTSIPELLVSTYREALDRCRLDEDRVEDDEDVEGLHVAVIHTAGFPMQYSAMVKMECTCSAGCSFLVKGIADDCVLTSYIFRGVHCTADVAQSETSFANTTAIYAMTHSDESIHSTFSNIFPISAPTDRLLDCTASPFPLFPNESDTTYRRYLCKCLRIMELWVHKQCFYGKQFYKIPEDICAYPVNVELGSKDKKGSFAKPKQANLIYLQILNNLAGADALKAVKPAGDYPPGDPERVAYMHAIYQNVLDFLTSKQGMLSHVQPEHLLEYDDYVIYMKKVHAQQDASILNEDTYYLYLCQNWMDVLLQTCKIFVLTKVKLPKRILSMTAAKDSDAEVRRHLAKDSEGDIEKQLEETVKGDVQKQLEEAVIDWETIASMTDEDMEENVYGKHEVVLLAWLRYVFQKYHHLLFKHEALKDKVFSNFRDDLWDFLALILVTVVYCPYLYKELKDVYVPPTSYEEAFHNGSNLLLSWKKVNISYHLSPTELIFLNEAQLVMLTTYLFQTLPTLRPAEIIVMQAPLSLQAVKKVPVKNSSDATAVFQVIFFENEKGFFEADSESVTVGPKKTGHVLVTYYAKKIHKTRCILLLSGETPGYKYAKNITYYLEGIPDITYYDEVNHNTFKPHIYDQVTVTHNITSPYKVAATYDIYIHHLTPQDASSIESYKMVKEVVVPRILYNPANQICCDKDGCAVTYTTICPMSTINADFYIYLINEEVGDFCVRFRVEPKKKRKELFEEISIRLPRGFLELPCYCTDKKLFSVTCPKTLSMFLPCRNKIMWSCIEKMFVEAFGDGQFRFWKKYLGTPTGAHLLQRMMQIHKEETPTFLKHTFNVTVEYDVHLEQEQGSEVSLLPDVIIEDVHSSDKMEFPVHINTKDIPSSFYFSMVSKDQLEYRFYQVKFLSDAFTKISFDSLSTEEEEEEELE